MRYVNACAYFFRSDRSLMQMFEALNGLDLWRWIERDNDRFGEHISTCPLQDPDRGSIRLFAESDHFAIDIVLMSEDETGARAAFTNVREQVFKQILPSLGARDISEIDPNAYLR